MKKIVLYSVFYLFAQVLFGQSIELSGGINRNSFFDWQKNDAHYITDYTPANGYNLALSFCAAKTEPITIRVSLLLDNYKGSIYTQAGGLAGSSTTSAEIEKTCLGIGLYPVNFLVLKNISFSFGAEYSYKIMSQTSGFKSSQIAGYSSYMTIENDSMTINKDFFWGVSGRIGYEFKINQDWSISPQYKFYLGMSDEFKNTNAMIRSVRHSLNVGIIRRIR